MLTADSLPFNRPLHGLPSRAPAGPSDKSLGYFQSSAHADLRVATVWAKRGLREIQSTLDQKDAPALAHSVQTPAQIAVASSHTSPAAPQNRSPHRARRNQLHAASTRHAHPRTKGNW